MHNFKYPIHRIYQQILLLIGITAVTSCTYYNEEDLFGETICDTTAITFETHIQPLLQQKECTSCHNTNTINGNIQLDTKERFIKAAQSGKLLGAIKHEQGFSAMPQGRPQLTPCNILTIETWLKNEGIVK